MKPSRFVGVWTATVAAVVIAIGAALSAQAQAFQSGFRMLKVPYYDGYIDVALWYPSNAAEADRSFGAYRMQVSMNAQAALGKFPLVVISMKVVHPGGAATQVLAASHCVRHWPLQCCDLRRRESEA